jgi:hypothetical protein
MAFVISNYQRAKTWAELASECPSNGRHDYAISLAGRMHSAGEEPDFIVQTLYDMLLSARFVCQNCDTEPNGHTCWIPLELILRQFMPRITEKP